MSTKAQQIPAASKHTIRILKGDTFLVSDEYGDISDPVLYGLFYHDTRFLSKFCLTINNTKPEIVTAKEADYFSACFFLCNEKIDSIPEKTISIVRKRLIDKIFHEELYIDNHNLKPVKLAVKFEFANDFADLFEVRAQSRIRHRAYTIAIDKDKKGLSFTYKKDSFFRKAEIRFSKAGKVSKDTALFSIEIPPQGRWQLAIDVEISTKAADMKVTNIKDFEECESEMEQSIIDWGIKLPKLKTNSELLSEVYKRSCIDLAALRLQTEDFNKHQPLSAAGLPWYMTLFGRDALIAGYQCLPIGPELAKNALLSLAERQGTKIDDFTDQQPGRILHELRRGELTFKGDEPYSPYYGTIDATILFLIVLSETYLWTGDTDFLEKLKEPAFKALQWMDEYGDSDHDGYIEYQTRSRRGVRNQGWKDSEDAIVFADGSLAEPPIAVCEVQGYAYMAWKRMSELMKLWNNEQLSEKLINKANDLKQRFNKDFWIESNSGFFALGLDRDKRLIDSRASNMGQLLWTGIVDEDKAQLIAQQLMGKNLYSGWGIRTLANNEQAYNPIKYHRGTVWPHDNSIIAAGLNKYGFTEYATKITVDLLEAASHFDYRLPEAFAGYEKGRSSFPARYPSSCSPQAWAAGAPILLLRTLLGLGPDLTKKELRIAPQVPTAIEYLEWSEIPAYGKKFKIEVNNGSAAIECMSTVVV